MSEKGGERDEAGTVGSIAGKAQSGLVIEKKGRNPFGAKFPQDISL